MIKEIKQEWNDEQKAAMRKDVEDKYENAESVANSIAEGKYSLMISSRCQKEPRDTIKAHHKLERASPRASSSLNADSHSTSCDHPNGRDSDLKRVPKKIYEPLFLDEGPNDTIDTTVTLEGEDTLAMFRSNIRGQEYSARPFLPDAKIRIEMNLLFLLAMLRPNVDLEARKGGMDCREDSWQT